jgi:hypothetical protein
VLRKEGSSTECKSSAEIEALVCEKAHAAEKVPIRRWGLVVEIERQRQSDVESHGYAEWIRRN